MRTAIFNPISFKKLCPGEKYLPVIQDGFPLPNELLQFMDCLVSVSYITNVRNGKVNHNESEIGFKILLSVLPGRNVEYFMGSWLSVGNLSYYCNGYSEKSIRKGAEWLVKKGLLKKRSVANNKTEFQVNYTPCTYEEIAKDIARQIENDVKKEDIVFKGIRYLTTTEYKKENDSKAIGNFTRIPFFLPSAKGREVEGEIVFDYARNPIFDSLDGNTLRVILQLAYKMHYNIGRKNTPETGIKIETLMKLCGLSRNKVMKALNFLKEGNYLRVYKVRRNSRVYLFNFKAYRMAKVRKQLDQRRRKRIHRPITIHASFTIPRQLVQCSLTVSENEGLPSQDLYNKNLILTKVQEINKDRVGVENLEVSSKEETPETNVHDKIKKDLLSDFRNLLISYTQFNELNTYLEGLVKKGEKIMSKTALIERYKESERVLAVQEQKLLKTNGTKNFEGLENRNPS